MKSKIHIEGLILTASIGVYDYEKVKQQSLLVDLTLTLDLNKAMQSDQIADTLDYEQVAQLCRTVAALRHYHLLENFGASLAHELSCLWRPLAIKIVIKKEQAVADARFAAFILEEDFV